MSLSVVAHNATLQPINIVCLVFFVCWAALSAYHEIVIFVRTHVFTGCDNDNQMIYLATERDELKGKRYISLGQSGNV